MSIDRRVTVEWSSASGGAAVAAGAEDFEQVAVDLEVVLTGQRVSQVADRTGVERNGRATACADEMMAVDRGAGDIDRASGTIENPGSTPSEARISRVR